MKLALNILVLSGMILITACGGQELPEPQMDTVNPALNKAHCMEVLSTHLNAVAQKDFPVLKSTLLPSGQMNLILPGSEPTYTSSEFLEFHREWFEDPSWSFEATIIDSEVGTDQAIVWVRSMYSEPERDGVPYFNEMMITYGLKKVDGHWYVRHDHASSIKKSTDEL